MNAPTTSTSTESKSDKNKRRSFLVERIAARGLVTYEEIRERFGKDLDHEVIRRDANALRLAGHNIDFDRHGRRGVIFSTTLRKQSIHDKRAEINAAGKSEIGELCEFLLLGDDDFGPSQTLSSHGFFEALKEEFNRIKANLKSSKIDDVSTRATELEDIYTARHDALLKKLRAYWMLPTKTGFLGSGTTTEAVAGKIRNAQIPSAVSATCQMSLWTNSRHIFYELGAPDCDFKMIMLGGSQRRQSGAVVGEMPTRMLSCFDPTFDIAISGTTSIDPIAQVVRADNDQDSQLKNEVFRRASIKVLVADSESKFDNQDQGSEICSISPFRNNIDLIISDGGITEETKREIFVPVITLKSFINARVHHGAN